MNPADTDNLNCVPEKLHRTHARKDTLVGQHDQVLCEVVETLRNLSANVHRIRNQADLISPLPSAQPKPHRFSTFSGSVTPAHLSVIGSSPLPVLSAASHHFISLQYIYSSSSPTLLPDCCFNRSGSYDSRSTYFIFLVMQFSCLSHANLYPRIITRLPVLLFVCLPVNNFQASLRYPCLQCCPFIPFHSCQLHSFNITLLSPDPHSLPTVSHLDAPLQQQLLSYCNS